MLYWLDNFTQCLSPFFHQSMGLNPISYTIFLTFYADLIKWADELARHSQQAGPTGWPDIVSRPHDVPGPELWPTGRLARAGPPFGY
jgi:hypothetical protein